MDNFTTNIEPFLGRNALCELAPSGLAFGRVYKYKETYFVRFLSLADEYLRAEPIKGVYAKYSESDTELEIAPPAYPTLIDMFAMAACNGFIAEGFVSRTHDSISEVAKLSYDVAEAMKKEKDSRNG